ncbi:hypothetical protein GLOIN_2v1483424 [Rhizophagus irregularis DAOM 181602=DAOM 197198]|nr:hypothetical protein GLOIN_2v1483424 [Rhizophagus irregularis DAOM 181602=DAOM 197198]
MMLSLNCLILGQASKKSLTENIGETYEDDSGVVIEFSKFTVSNFKEKLFHREEVKVIVQNTGKMDLWKVDGKKVYEEENNLKEFTKSDIKDKLRGEKMIPQFPLEDYFKAKETNIQDIHVFIVSTSTGPSQQGISQVTTIFKEFLNSKHGEFLKKYIRKNDPLPSYKLRIHLKSIVPASFTGGRPTLLKYNLPRSNENHEPITHVSNVQSTIAEAKNNLLIFLGTSGYEKMRTWGLYFVTSRKGNGGSADIEKIQTYLEIKMTKDFEQNCKSALGIMLLKTVLKGKFKSRTDEQKRSLLFPIIQALREPAVTMVNYCVISCSSGLRLLSLENVLITGVLKPETEIFKFTEFGGWQDIAHVKNYVNNLVSLTDNKYNCLHKHFCGRFHPIITCVEEIIMGLLAQDVINVHWKVLTKVSDNDQSLYHQLCRIIKMERLNHVLSTNILNLYKSVILAYYYSRGPFLFTDISQRSLVESSFRRFQFVNPPTIYHLKQVYKGVDEEMLRISSVNVDLLHLALEGKKSLVACVDEPFAFTAANNDSSWKTLWQIYLPDEFERIFNGQSDIKNMPVFAEVTKKYNLPNFCYILDKFFNESPETRPTFYFPENRCGPDIIFFVEFKKVTVPVFVQVKLYYGVKNLAQALSMIHPHMFYKNKNEVVYDEKSNKSIIDKIIEKCKVGSIGLLVAYLADIFQESYVTNDHTHYLKNRSSTKQLIRIIDYKNASTVFQEAHLQFLDKLKRTAKRNRKEEASEEASKEVGKEGENNKSKKSRKPRKKPRNQL